MADMFNTCSRCVSCLRTFICGEQIDYTIINEYLFSIGLILRVMVQILRLIHSTSAVLLSLSELWLDWMGYEEFTY